MKGTFFQRPFEFSLLVEGEAWHQGDSIRGELRAKNHGQEPLPKSELRVQLARGELKKVRQKSPAAFKVLATGQLGATGTLGTGEEVCLPWSFQTELNAPISDVSSSLFLLYGRGEGGETSGQLQLTILPSPIIEEFIKAFEVGFRFVVKTRKFSKGAVEIKLAPPTAKNFATLDHLVLAFSFQEGGSGAGDDLQIRYSFAVKKIEATASSLKASKAKKELEQILTRAQYLMPSGRINHEQMEQSIRDALQSFQ